MFQNFCQSQMYQELTELWWSQEAADRVVIQKPLFGVRDPWSHGPAQWLGRLGRLAKLEKMAVDLPWFTYSNGDFP